MRLLGRLAILGPALALISFAVARAGASWDRLRRWLRTPDAASGQWCQLALCALGVLASSWLLFGVLQGRALLDDELTYAHQAQLLAEWRLAEDRVPQWSGELFTIWTRLGATGKYLFGEPLVQVPGWRLGIPALLHLPILVITLLAWYRTVAGSLGSGVAAWATALVAVCPMVIVTTATGLSSATSLACIALAGLGLTLEGEGRPWAAALITGQALGFVLTVRPQVAAPMGAVLGTVLLLRLVRRRRAGPAVALAASAGAWTLLVLAYNRALTGDPFTLPWSLFRPLEHYGFGRPLEGDPFVHTPWTAVENLLVTAVRFNGWWLGWPLSLALLVVWWRWGRQERGARTPLVRVYLAAGAALVLFHVPYYSTGVSETGPIYFYELVLPLSLLGALALAAAWRRWPVPTAATLAVHLTLGTAGFVVESAARLERLVAITHGPVEAAMAAVEPPALLLYEPSPSETVRLGWVNSGFPKRERSAAAPVVIYPRSGRLGTAALRRHYRDRRCYYYRVVPQTLTPELRRCADVEPLLARPYRLQGPALAVRSTAMAKGWIDPFRD